MTSYLKPGETLQSRAEDLMAELRTTPTNAPAVIREKLSQEIQGIGVLAATLPAATVTLESFDFEGERADVVTIDAAMKALEGIIGGHESFPGQPEARARFLRLLVGAEPYSFTPEATRNLSDTLGLVPNADGTTPRLPGEQSVATDPHPEIDFETEIDVQAETLDEVGRRSDLDDLDPATIPEVEPTDKEVEEARAKWAAEEAAELDDEDDDDLADFAPQAKAKEKPETALSALKKKSTKKETNR